MGFTKPSKIQEKALPALINDPPQNLIAQSQSGTGKTAAFTLTMLTRIDTNLKYPQVSCSINLFLKSLKNIFNKNINFRHYV